MSFDTTFHQLASVRSQYESMRSSGAPLSDLIEARVNLLYLRAEMARVRKEMR
ncbi:MAG: hypothetical protein V3R84_01540 [Acidimicrobiia bacterium]